MSLALDTKNAALETLNEIVEVSLHTHYSADGSAFEIPPIGDPGFEYARVPVSFSEASNAVKFSAGILQFNVPASYQVAWIGLWNAFGECRGMLPNGGENPSNPLLPFTLLPGDIGTGLLLDTSQNITSVYADTHPQLWFWHGGVGTFTLPDELAFNGPWTVLGSNGGYGFTVSLLGEGADPQVFSTWGWGFWQRIVVQPFVAQGVFQLNSLVFSAYG
jgi:hypothetical protein